MSRYINTIPSILQALNDNPIAAVVLVSVTAMALLTAAVVYLFRALPLILSQKWQGATKAPR
jgi:branched-subunit amino acid transport protein